MSNSFDKLSVLDLLIEEVNSYLPEIEANLERLAQLPSGGSPVDMEAVEETYRRTHTIGGSASMMDFPGLAHVAHGMEDILGDVMEGLASLDVRTLGLLQRSFARLNRLVQGIRDGVDEDAIIAEDDADYVQYRALVDNAGQAAASGHGGQEIPAPIAGDMPTPASPALPSIDEVLASFKTPISALGEEIGWPEDPATPETSAQSADQPTAPIEVGASALDMLVATTRSGHEQNDVPPAAAPQQQDLPLEQESVQAGEPAQPAVAAQVGSADNEQQGQLIAAETQSDTVVAAPSFAHAYAEMRGETQSLAQQTSSLSDMLRQLRGTIAMVEDQRSEFKGFLDGSRDALERMEDWAGQVMGLNLRNSPEQVRRYLPLSVMWASNAKLKKVLEMLKQVTSGVEVTDEQFRTILAQMFFSLESCEKAFQQVEVQTPAYILAQEAGWTPWEVPENRNPNELRDRLIFERRGDPAALRSEIEAQVREELRREYENRDLSLSLVARNELEQQIRREVRQEFAARRQLQSSVTGLETSETPAEVEERLRSEIEI